MGGGAPLPARRIGSIVVSRKASLLATARTRASLPARRVLADCARGGTVRRKAGEYVRRWVPALRDMPDAFIYEPWKAPRAVQERAGCVVGRDYPAPIVEHGPASKENMERMKAAYDAHKAQKAQKAPGKSRAPAASAPPRKRAKA